jgi:hypothetical protein
VPWTKGEVRIPVAELRRFQRDGIPSLQVPRSAPAPSRRILAENDDDIGSIQIK